MIWFWLFICLIMIFSAGAGFYIGALFEKEKLKTDHLDDVKTQAYHLGNEPVLKKEKHNKKITTPTCAQSSDVVKNMKGQDKKYCRLKSAAKE